jgi:signal transduction histidine kinase
VLLSASPIGLEVRVMDRGFGIPDDEAERIFERFYRSERTSGLAGGAGMGLAVCKRLIEAMSGVIWARSREGGGLEVGFSLPLYEEQEV